LQTIPRWSAATPTLATALKPSACKINIRTKFFQSTFSTKFSIIS
jgi:hypothetical protein